MKEIFDTVDESDDRPTMGVWGEVYGKLPGKAPSVLRVRTVEDDKITGTPSILKNKAFATYWVSRLRLPESVVAESLKCNYRKPYFHGMEIKDAPVVKSELEPVEPVGGVVHRFLNAPVPKFDNLPLRSRKNIIGIGVSSGVGLLMWCLFDPWMFLMIPATVVATIMVLAVIAGVALKIDERLYGKPDAKAIGKVKKHDQVPAGTELFLFPVYLGERLEELLKDLPDDYNLHFMISYKFQVEDRVPEISRWLGMLGALYEMDPEYPVHLIPIMYNDLRKIVKKLDESKAFYAKMDSEVAAETTAAMRGFVEDQSSATLELAEAYLERHRG